MKTRLYIGGEQSETSADFVCAAAAFSCLTVITFDDLSGTVAPIPSNYAGLTWDSEWNFWTGNGSTFIPLSAPNLAYFNTTNDGIQLSEPGGF